MYTLSEVVEELWALICDGSRSPIILDQSQPKYHQTPPLWMVPYGARELIWDEISQVCLG